MRGFRLEGNQMKVSLSLFVLQSFVSVFVDQNFEVQFLLSWRMLTCRRKTFPNSVDACLGRLRVFVPHNSPKPLSKDACNITAPLADGDLCRRTKPAGRAWPLPSHQRRSAEDRSFIRRLTTLAKAMKAPASRLALSNPNQPPANWRPVPD